MSRRCHALVRLAVFFSLALAAAIRIGAAEEGAPSAGYVPDPAIEQVIQQALDADKAVSYPAMKHLKELGPAAARALKAQLFSEKTTAKRRALCELIARCTEGKVGYRVTVELNSDGSGKLRFLSDRSLLADCAQEYDRLVGNAPQVFNDEALRYNPYSEVELARHLNAGVKYQQGENSVKDDRIIASSELSFSNFDDLSSFANSFDRSGYHMLSGISLTDGNNNLRTVHFKKSAELDRKRSTDYLYRFHDVKWEFVLIYHGAIKSSTATHNENGIHTWQFNCAEMSLGEAEYEASFDPKGGAPTSVSAAKEPENNAPGGDEPIAVPARKVLNVAVGHHDVPNGPETEVVLDGRPSIPKNSGLRHQWIQTQGLSLNLPIERLAQPLIKLRIFQMGEYRFQLTTSLNGKTSQPAEVIVYVGDGTQLASADPSTPSGSGSVGESQTQKVFQLQNRTPLVEKTAPKVAQNPPESAPPPVAPPAREESHIAQVSPMEMIRMAEEEFTRGTLMTAAVHSFEIAQNQPTRREVTPPVPAPVPTELNQPLKAVEKVVANATENTAGPTRNPVLEAPAIPPVPRPIPANETLPEKGVDVAANRLAIEEIRKAEDEYNKSGGTPKADIPAVTPLPAPRETAAPFIKVTQPALDATSNSPKEAATNPKTLTTAPTDETKTDIKVTKEIQSSVPPIQPADLKAFEKELANTAKEAHAPPAASPPSPATEDKPLAAKIQPTAPAVAPPVPPAPVVTEKTAVPPEPSVAVSGNPLQQGTQLFKAARYAQAVEVLKKADPKDEEAQFALAVALLENAERPDSYDRAGTLAALDKFTAIAEANPKNVAAVMYIGHCNARIDRMQETVQCYKAVITDPKNKDHYHWETKWQMGNKYLKQKDAAGAIEVLTEAEESAAKGKVEDPRLLRDMALAQHLNGKDDEAAKRLNALQELGYAVDPALAAEINQKIPNAIALKAAAPVADPKTAPVETAAIKPVPAVAPPAIVPVKEEDKTAVKPTEPAVAPLVAKNETKANAPRLGSSVSGNPQTIPVEAPAAVTPKIAVPAPVVADGNPTRIVAKETAVATAVPPPVPPMNPNDVPAPTPREHHAAAAAASPKVLKPATPPAPKRIPPPIPARFEEALEAGRAALERGLTLHAQTEVSAKAQAQAAFDDAEDLLRGAWNLKPGDPEVTKELERLVEQVHVIALVKSTLVLSKPKGLVVLNAEPSMVFPKDKTMYFAWEQVEGKELPMRREDVATRRVGLRIKDPGIYKFELVVSDGVRGGNPVTVTVEVRE